MGSYQVLFFVFFFVAQAYTLYVRPGYDFMKCSYGERGSLTATCVNATTNYFKMTPYRFDHLDETLRCLNCSLTTIETASFDISGNQIRNLDLSNSMISTIRQRAFVGLIFLEKLILANNQIKSIYPGTFIGVKKISDVTLENNSITILSADGFLELISLEKLNLKKNFISSIDKSAFNGLVHLEFLDLSHNEISNVQDVFNNLTALKILDLSNNKIQNVGTYAFENLTSLLELKLSNNYMKLIPAMGFMGMTKLRRLDLSFNTLEKIISGSFKGLHAMEDLDLSNNNIAEIPQKTLQSLHNLQFLNASFNKLTVFQTGLYSGLPQLRVLNFSDNAIEAIEITGVFSLENLDTLDFSRNNISDVDYVTLVSRLPKISYLSLEDNFLPCALEKEMEDYFEEDNFKFILYRLEGEAVQCVDKPITPRHHRKSHKEAVTTGGDEGSGSSTATHVWIFVLMGFILVLIGLLYYVQLRNYRELRTIKPIARTTSEAQLITSSDLQARDNDYLKE